MGIRRGTGEGHDMIRSSRRTITGVAVALVALASAVGTLGITALDGGPSAGATPSGAATVVDAGPVTGERHVAPPQLDDLLQMADYVSEDGTYVRMGDVELSATSVSRLPEG